jgi:hypothetical protein
MATSRLPTAVSQYDSVEQGIDHTVSIYLAVLSRMVLDRRMEVGRHGVGWPHGRVRACVGGPAPHRRGHRPGLRAPCRRAGAGDRAPGPGQHAQVVCHDPEHTHNII